MKKIVSYFTIIVCLLILGDVKSVYAAEIKTDDITNSTYVIGKCMFTRDISDKYSGSLSTDVIMLAAKTIDSNNLEDMIIYYKNARGIWVNALNNEQVEMNETVEIDYKNNVEYIQAPTLTNAYGNSIPGGEVTAGLNVISEGAYSIDTGNLSGYEVYEKIDGKYVLINTNESDQKFTKDTLVAVDIGESKTYVARVYAYNQTNEKLYSDYSNEVVIDNSKILAPTLTNAYGNSIPGGEVDAGLNVISEGAYSIDTGNLSGYEVYEKIDGKYVLINTNESDQKFTKDTLVAVDIGESKTYIARVYAYNGENEKIYSDYSNEVVIDNSKILAPTLTNAYGNSIPGGEVDAGLNVISEGAYSIDTGNLSGYEVYEKIDGKYVLINTNESDQKFTKDTLVAVDIGESKTYVARVYAYNGENEKIYSDYSNEVVIDNSVIETPTLTNVAGDATTAQLTVVYEGIYANDTTSISGYELYEKNGNTLTLVDTNETTFRTTVNVNAGESKTYVAKVYVYNQSNEKIYSDYSNEVVVDKSI